MKFKKKMSATKKSTIVFILNELGARSLNYLTGRIFILLAGYRTFCARKSPTGNIIGFSGRKRRVNHLKGH